MAVYYKFKSAKDYDSISIDGHFITVASLKEKIFENKHLGKGTDFDLVVTNAQTNEEYLDEGMLIPKNTSVLIRRVPGRGRARLPIITTPITTDQDKPVAENKLEDAEATKSSFSGVDPSVSKYPEEFEWDEFGNDLYSMPEVAPVQDAPTAPPPSKADEDSKIRALIDTPALDWQCQNPDSFGGGGRGFGRGMGGRSGGRGFGRGGLLERTTPPPGYICHRCKVPGHFIQHCPTNGDSNYDIKRTKPPTGIPKSMLMATPDGSYALPSGAAAVLKPNEAAFEKEIEGMPSTRSVADLPQELYCPLCRAVMKDAVLTSKCCFNSYCDKCIRDYIISKSMCICGATNVLADDLLPNKTVRVTIVRILEANNSSGDNGGSAFQPQDMESARSPQRKIPSPKGAEFPEATHESRSAREPGSQMCPPVADEEMQQKPVSGEVGKKKKKKKARLPVGVTDMQWRPPQDFAAENYMMPMEPSGFNPYWNGMQPGFDGFGGPYGGPMPFMGYGLGPGPMPFGGPFPHDPFGAQGYMMPFPPQRDLAEFGMGFNGGGGGGPPIMSREEFEARKATIKHKRDLERGGGSREVSRDREFSRDMISNGDVPPGKSKFKSNPPPQDYHHPRARSERPERLSPERITHDPEPLRASSKRKMKYEDDYYEEHPHQHREKERRHHHRSESEIASSARSPIPPETLILQSSMAATTFSSLSHKISISPVPNKAFHSLSSSNLIKLPSQTPNFSSFTTSISPKPPLSPFSTRPRASTSDIPATPATAFHGVCYVVGDNIDTDQIIPAEYLTLVPSNPEEYKKLGSFALIGLPVSKYPTRFMTNDEFSSKYSILIAGDNFGCGSSREHAPVALGAAGVKAVVAESYARIFFRNSVSTGEVYPLESEKRLCEECKTGDVITIELGESLLINHTSGKDWNDSFPSSLEIEVSPSALGYDHIIVMMILEFTRSGS
ncbi:DWNN domain-containing protein [Heracleum sosnowskyi]|uniref:DWNN domain-containing protein n=1 Tax=Heracleum sosnowskyi TaxID=360622 RepID=A0AAD8I2B4_9APIA|nr:DWNN domain-containing protein [Heracleum sosnowskyi]